MCNPCNHNLTLCAALLCWCAAQEEVQLREQDFGNFQNPTKIQADLAERNRFGRFYYRCAVEGREGGDGGKVT